MISSAATHGFLPLLSRDESIRFQLLVGRTEHARHFGELPRGCWVPECAYRPAGPWQPLPSARRQPIRSGIEDHLRYAGFQWFFVDAHIVEAGQTYDLYTGRTRRRPEKSAKRSPHRAYRVGNVTRGRPIYVLVRDPTTTTQVWSRHGGYPGDGSYLEFHKIRYPGGLKLWRVTDSGADLGAKEPYDPRLARDMASRHAAHFQALLDTLAVSAKPGDNTIIAPFDTELFGHWWFEGMDFLKFLYEDMSADTAAQPVSAGRRASGRTARGVAADERRIVGQGRRLLHVAQSGNGMDLAPPLGAGGTLLERRARAPSSAGMPARYWSRRGGNSCWHSRPTGSSSSRPGRPATTRPSASTNTATRSKHCFPFSRTRRPISPPARRSRGSIPGTSTDRSPT